MFCGQSGFFLNKPRMLRALIKKKKKVSIKRSVFWYIPFRFAKAYVEQFLGLPNAMYSHSVRVFVRTYICDECIKES